jgi:hypothetical protein
VTKQEFTTCAPDELLFDVLANMHTGGLTYLMLIAQ